MNIRPLRDKVVVEKIENVNTTQSGIILRSTGEPDRAKIISIGPEVQDVKVGDVALIDWNAAVKVENYYVISDKNIVFIYGD